MNTKYISLFVFFSFLIFSFGLVNPASVYAEPITADISIELNPAIPGPNQRVTATASSYSVELNSSQIIWTINGKVVSKGTGATTFSFTTGSGSSSTVLGVSVSTVLGQFIQKTYTIKPATVDLIWQTDGYTPALYKGKALFVHENKIQFVAIPHIIKNGSEVPASNLIYKWTRNGEVLGDFSGYGKNTYTMISGIISRPLEIEVEVTSPTSDDIASASIVAEPLVPHILFYEKNPLYGIQFQKALGDKIDMAGKQEIEIVSVPYFFNTSSLSYDWTINGTSLETTNGNQSQVFRQKEGVYGQSLIGLSIENTVRMLQYTQHSMTISFTKPTQ